MKRKVELAVGRTNGTWFTLWEDVVEYDVTTDEELRDRAKAQALDTMNEYGVTVAFIIVLHVEEPPDPLDGVV